MAPMLRDAEERRNHELAAALREGADNDEKAFDEIQELRTRRITDRAQAARQQTQPTPTMQNPETTQTAGSRRLPDAPGSAAWYRKRAKGVRYNGRTVSQYNHYLGIAEAIEMTQLNCQPNDRSAGAADTSAPSSQASPPSPDATCSATVFDDHPKCKRACQYALETTEWPHAHRVCPSGECEFAAREEAPNAKLTRDAGEKDL